RSGDADARGHDGGAAARARRAPRTRVRAALDAHEPATPDRDLGSEKRGVSERAVVLLSGGLDSTTCLAWALSRGLACYTLAFDYGQRHRVELECARRVSQALGAREHRELRVDLGAIGGSALTDALPVPKDRDDRAMGSGIPITYVPARNTVFLALAMG